MKIGEHSRRLRCSLCRGEYLELAMDMGETPIANEYGRSSDPEQVDEVFPLDIVVCTDCGHAQLDVLIDPERLFPPGYAYATGTSPKTIGHLANQWCELRAFYEARTGLLLDKKSFVVEIGSNDGSLLKMLMGSSVTNVLGVEPATSLCHYAMKEHGVPCLNKPFTGAVGKSIRDQYDEADVVIANNVFAHVADVRDMAEGVQALLTDGGLFAFEVSYLMDMTEGLFDTIYHEHLSYHAVRPLAQMLDSLGMPIVSARTIGGQVGRGSLRIIACKSPGRSIECGEARDLMMKEAAAHAWDKEFFHRLVAKIREQREVVQDWVKTLQKSGEHIVGYGAAAKTTTFMSVMGLDEEHIDFIVDDAERKQGMLMPGSRIKIYHPNALRGGTCIVFSWNFADDVILRNNQFKGTWLTFLPRFREISGGANT
jgi:2-polyprenyl-3-methyl-5-hydroxy-6-metoxy-1,4-benzoquinol methylase